jgi:hypothetical protein
MPKRQVRGKRKAATMAQWMPGPAPKPRRLTSPSTPGKANNIRYSPIVIGVAPPSSAHRTNTAAKPSNVAPKTTVDKPARFDDADLGLPDTRRAILQSRRVRQAAGADSMLGDAAPTSRNAFVLHSYGIGQFLDEGLTETP